MNTQRDGGGVSKTRIQPPEFQPVRQPARVAEQVVEAPGLNWFPVLVFSSLALVFLLIVSCSPGSGLIEAAPILEPEKVPVSLDGEAENRQKTPSVVGSQCLNVTCGDDQVCLKGKCQCKEGLKSCQGACIPKTSCCSGRDCAGTDECIAGECRFSCAKVICPTNQVCDESQKRCTCPTGYRFCEVQHKCIPLDHCCDKFDCDRGLICTATVYSARVCLFTRNPTCKYFGDKTSKIMELDNNQSFEVTAAEFLYGKKVRLLVDSLPLEMSDSSREVINGSITISLDDVREIGGTCRQPKARERI